MSIAYHILLVIALLAIVFQDFKLRAISWYWIPVLFISSVLYSQEVIALKVVFQNILLNSSLVVFQILILTAYFSIKNKAFTNIIDTYLGLGDVLFLAAITPFFTTLNYILFLSFSFLIILILSVLIKIVLKKWQQNIPLAGGIALVLLILLIIQLKLGVNFMLDDAFVMNILLSGY